MSPQNDAGGSPPPTVLTVQLNAAEPGGSGAVGRGDRDGRRARCGGGPGDQSGGADGQSGRQSGGGVGQCLPRSRVAGLHLQADRGAHGRGLAAGVGHRHRVAGAGGRIDLEFVDGVAVLGGADGAVHADIAAAARYVEGLGAAAAGGGRVDAGPGGVVVGGLDLEGLGGGGFPVDGDLADGLGGAEVDLEQTTREINRRLGVLLTTLFKVW